MNDPITKLHELVAEMRDCGTSMIGDYRVSEWADRIESTVDVLLCAAPPAVVVPEHDDAPLAAVLLLLAWQAGEVSEGQFCKALNTDRLTARAERDKHIAAGVSVFNSLRPNRDRPNG